MKRHRFTKSKKFLLNVIHQDRSGSRTSSALLFSGRNIQAFTAVSRLLQSISFFSLIIMVINCGGPTLVKDPWDNSAQARYYQIDRITTNSQAAEAFKKGCKAAAEGRYDQAVNRFQEAVQQDVQMWEAFYELGRTYRALQEYEPAIQNIEQALILAPDRDAIRQELQTTKQEASRYYYQQGRKVFDEGAPLEAAASFYQKALAADPMNLDALNALGNHHYQLKNSLLATHYFQMVLNQDPNNREALISLARIHNASGNYLKAQAILVQARSFYEGDVEIEQLMAQVERGLEIGNRPSELLIIEEKKVITRADLAALLVTIIEPRSLLWKSLVQVSTPLIILDISDHWAQTFIREIIEYRIMTPFRNHTFKPDNSIHRYELAAILDYIMRHAGHEELASSTNLTDSKVVDVSSEHSMFESIRKVVSLKLMNCDQNGKFSPNGTLEGHQTISILTTLKKMITQQHTN